MRRSPLTASFLLCISLSLSVARAHARAEAAPEHPIPTLAETNIAGPVVALNLDDCVKKAILEATLVQKAKNDNELTGTQLIQGYAQFLPNLAATASYTNIEGKQYLTTAQPTTVEGRSHGMGYQISSTLNIFNGFSDTANLNASLARRDASGLSLTRAKQQIALDVAQSYLQVVLDKQIVKIAERNLESSRAREALLSAQSQVGTRSIVDLYRQQAQTSSDELFSSDAQNKERTDELLLVRKLRLDPAARYDFKEADTDAAISKVTAAAYADEAKLVDIALSNRPDLKAESQFTKAFRSDLTVARANFFPKLDFGLALSGGGRALDSQLVNGVDVTTGAQSIGDQLPNRVWTAGVVFTWNIFDRWLTKTNVERASIALKNATLDLDDLHNQVVGEVRQAFGDYQTVLQQMESSEKGLTAARKSFEATEARYKVGAASFVDLLTAQATLVQADAARAQAHISYALKSKVLETVTGTASIN